MRGSIMKRTIFAYVVTTLLLAVVIISSVSCSGGESPEAQAMKAKLKAFEDERAIIEKDLATFDTLDYTVFSNQEWTRLHESHAKDIKVYWPDGHMTQGLDAH